MRALLQILAVVLSLSPAAWVSAETRAGPDISGSRQLVTVITPDWNSADGRMQAFERHDGHWQPVGEPEQVSIGKNGSAWGLGLHAWQPGPVKIEGDGKAPAGIFSIGNAFGYAEAMAISLPYQAMDSTDWCVDVSDSPWYNRIVSTDDVGLGAVQGSSEPMRRDIYLNGDPVYRKGFVINHNPGNVPKGGSCIFAHLWRAQAVPTAGCTAMSEPAMDALLAWLDADENPLFVLLPESEYLQLQALWQLPEPNP